MKSMSSFSPTFSEFSEHCMRYETSDYINLNGIIGKCKSIEKDCFFSVMLGEFRPVWQGVSTDSLKFHLGPPCPTLLCSAGRPSPKRPYARFLGGLLKWQAACGRPLPPWIPHAVRAWVNLVITSTLESSRISKTLKTG
jgi:hypothetical protein